jgi:glycerol kinase
MSEAVLALDQGTTGSTARVFARDGRVLGGAYSEFTQHGPAGWSTTPTRSGASACA